METKQSIRQGSGNFELNVYDGVLKLYKLSIDTMNNIKKNGCSESNTTIITNATYIIDEGVLYISGEVLSSKFIRKIDNESVFNEDYSDQENIDKVIDEYYIGEDMVYITQHKPWFKSNYSQRNIKMGYYLPKKGTHREYKTTLFRLIE